MPFSDISGHEKEINILKRSLAAGRLAHALLFAGPEGIGKRLVALNLAKALNCAEGGEDSCGVCADCSLMDSATHPNLLLVGPTDKEGNPDVDGLIRIDQIREVQNAVRYRVEGGRRVVVVDRAERLMPQAANAFLKTLEEPPAGSMIILIASKASELLPTILSRCQRISFRPLAREAVSEHLVKRLGASGDEAAGVARLSEGSISRAISLINEGAHNKRIELVKRLSAITPGDADEALKFAEELSKRDDLVEVLDFIKTWLRDLCVVSGGEPGLMVNSDLAQYADGARNIEELTEFYSMVEGAQREIMPPRYANKQLAMESLLLKITGCA